MIREGDYLVVFGDNYNYRAQLRALGGLWQPKRRAWAVRDMPGVTDTEQALRAIGIQMTVKMQRAAFCHEPAAVIWAEEGSTETHDNFCGMCDSQWREPVALEPVA